MKSIVPTNNNGPNNSVEKMPSATAMEMLTIRKKCSETLYLHMSASIISFLFISVQFMIWFVLINMNAVLKC